MQLSLCDLLNYLKVTAAGPDRFHGVCIPSIRRAAYGGQLMAQALYAAAQTVATERPVHSLHCHFLRGTRLDLPLEFTVQRLRDGGSFSTRQVLALQAGQPVFTALLSFQQPESGLSHQLDFPDLTPREQLLDDSATWGIADMTPLQVCREDVCDINPRDPHQYQWMRVRETLGDDPLEHQMLLVYMSDVRLITAAMLPHPLSFIDPAIQGGSLDHSMWFYGPARADEWLLYDMHSPLAGAGRGLNHGYFYTESGRLVAATSQEGLIRLRQPAPAAAGS